MFILRTIKILLACALVTWGGQSIAMAKPLMRDAAGSITLCTSHGIEQVVVDVDGVPIDDMPICPDCISTYAHIGVLAGVLDTPAFLLSAVVYAVAADQRTARDHPTPLARGPPLTL